jgi:hypothetical protein
VVNKNSRLSVIFIFVFILCVSFFFSLWKSNRLIIDAPSYYTYLPATIIYQDLQLKFIDKDPEFFKDKIWYYRIENGNRLIKHPMGLGVALAPFFILAHTVSKATGMSSDGYSLVYQNFITAGVLVYLLFGLLCLRKILLRFFNDTVVAFTLVSIVLGTNLLWYATFEALMTHALSFSLLGISLYFFFEWLDAGTPKNIIFFFLFFGLCVLIRPLAVTVGLYFLVAGILSKDGIYGFLTFIKLHLKPVLLALLFFCLIVSLQLFYWKYITGRWIYDAYKDERFLFDSPEIISFLFSFRKGIFIYTPVLIFSFIGLFRLFKINRPVFYATSLLITVTVYMLSSWWAWSYGICWGIRPMIDYYVFLSIPLAGGISFFLAGKKTMFYFGGGVLVLFILLNLFQTWQYKNGLIHYDDMSRESYFKGLFQTKRTQEWQELLKPYDWERRRKGLSQIDYSPSYFREKFKTGKIYMRGYNQQFVTVNEKAQNVIAAYQKKTTELSFFRIIPVNGDTVSIMAANGNFILVSKEYDNVLMASASPGSAEKFQIVFLAEDDNKIRLKNLNGNYVAVSDQFPYFIYVADHDPASKGTFHIFAIE